MSQTNQNSSKSQLASSARALGRPAASGTGKAAPPSCATALARVIELAQTLAQDTRETRKTLPSGRSREGETQTASSVESRAATGRERLTRALQELDPETALKLRTLMIAGRDSQSIRAVNVNLSMSDAEAGFAAMAADSGENGPLLIDYLRRGHAIACAAGLDLEGPLSDWQSQSAQDLDERAWVSFGRQLANSHPTDWQCLGIADPSTQQIGKLYLKLGDHAWWSFQAVLDRPTLGAVEKERRSLSKRRLKGVSKLDQVVPQLGAAHGRALRRAGRAICARMGLPNEAATATR